MHRGGEGITKQFNSKFIKAIKFDGDDKENYPRTRLNFMNQSDDLDRSSDENGGDVNENFDISQKSKSPLHQIIIQNGIASSNTGYDQNWIYIQPISNDVPNGWFYREPSNNRFYSGWDLYLFFLENQNQPYRNVSFTQVLQSYEVVNNQQKFEHQAAEEEINQNQYEQEFRQTIKRNLKKKRKQSTASSVRKKKQPQELTLEEKNARRAKMIEKTHMIGNYVCMVCGKIFKTGQGLGGHMSKLHHEIGQMFKDNNFTPSQKKRYLQNLKQKRKESSHQPDQEDQYIQRDEVLTKIQTKRRISAKNKIDRKSTIKRNNQTIEQDFYQSQLDSLDSLKDH